MNNSITEILDKYNLKVSKFSYINKCIIIDTNKGKYVLKRKKKIDKKEIYDYLLSRNFSFFLYPENIFTNDYEMYPYIDEINTLKEEKAKHLIDIMAEMHVRTTTYKEYSLDEIKEIYEEVKNKINSLKLFYENLEQKFSESIYPAPYELLFLTNVSKIYNSLDYGNILLEEWYKSVVSNRKRRICLIHNHLSLDHFIDRKDAKLINFDYSKYDSPVYDFVNFYKKHYYELDMTCLFSSYQYKYLYTKEEILLLFVSIILPNKIQLKKDASYNTYIIHQLVEYIDITRDFILKEQKKYQKEDEEKLNKK
jgi:hypothetical protein